MLFLGYLLAFGAASLLSFVGAWRARQVSDPDTRRGLVALLACSGGGAAGSLSVLLVPFPSLKSGFDVAGGVAVLLLRLHEPRPAPIPAPYGMPPFSPLGSSATPAPGCWTNPGWGTGPVGLPGHGGGSNVTTAFPFIGTGHVSLPGPGAEYRTTPEKLDRNQRRKEIDAYALMRKGDLTAPSWRL